MERDKLLEQVNDIFRDVLDNESLQLTDATTAHDVERWDSLTHIHIIIALERKFGIRFTSREIQSWENVGEMIDCLSTKIG